VTVAEPALYDELQRKNRRATWALLIGGVLLAALLVWVFFAFLAPPEVALDPGVSAVVTLVGRKAFQCSTNGLRLVASVIFFRQPGEQVNRGVVECKIEAFHSALPFSVSISCVSTG
jgi:peptidoglycan biosynthesis protein MviN/MurJ (putative lipid II flippase)